MQEARIPYPGRPSYPDPLPEFRGTATVRQTPAQREALLSFCAEQYRAGRSLRELAALTDRSQSAVRRALAQAGDPLRGRGAPSVAPSDSAAHS
ncbi:helix-turn-helix domain-containing protein [Ornithinimicrobium panacihumi]|uniref:helix-turn-helix domain-containing protein n=1 Tax=Ornithinimicrobium panacihumi TaxID=2008449 RepID=UPI003F8B4033